MPTDPHELDWEHARMHSNAIHKLLRTAQIAALERAQHSLSWQRAASLGAKAAELQYAADEALQQARCAFAAAAAHPA